MPLHQSKKLMKQTADLTVASPQVIAHRITQMSMAPFTLSPAALQELYTMTAEKVLVTQQSWLTISTEMAKLNQHYMNSMMNASWSPWTTKSPTPLSMIDYQRECLKILNKGIAPIRETAVSNAERLKNA